MLQLLELDGAAGARRRDAGSRASGAGDALPRDDAVPDGAAAVLRERHVAQLRLPQHCDRCVSSVEGSHVEKQEKPAHV